MDTGGNEVWRNEAGYNESTGLGSPDVYNLVRDILPLERGPLIMSDQPLNPPPATADMPPLPTQVCPYCSNVTPLGDYCGVCGSHLAHPHPGVAARRAHAYSANPEEHVLRLSVVSTLFPHLSHRSSAPFRAGFALLVTLLVVFSATGLEAPVIALAAMGVPLLFQLYIHEVDVYEDGHLMLTAETLLIGAALGVGWALLGGPIVSHALQPTLGATLGTWDVAKAAVLVPIVGQALMLVPLLLVLLFVPGFGGRRESLDGFSLGAASALGFTFAAVITDLANRLSDGLAPSRPFTNILTEALIRGIATPVLAAAATGLIGASIWAHRSEGRLSGRTLDHQPPGRDRLRRSCPDRPGFRRPGPIIRHPPPGGPPGRHRGGHPRPSGRPAPHPVARAT